LHVVWFTYVPEEYGIWYTTAVSDAPPVAPVPRSLPTSGTPGTTVWSEVSTPEPTRGPPATPDLADGALRPPNPPPWLPVAIGVLAAGLVAAAAIWLRRSRRI